jgi:hypothetical protein
VAQRGAGVWVSARSRDKSAASSGTEVAVAGLYYYRLSQKVREKR